MLNVMAARQASATSITIRPKRANTRQNVVNSADQVRGHRYRLRPNQVVSPLQRCQERQRREDRHPDEEVPR